MSSPTFQKIAVLLNLSDSDNMLIMNGIKLTSIFRKELLLVHYSKRESGKWPDSVKQRLHNLVIYYNKEVPGLKISGLCISGPASDLSLRLADENETIIIISDSKEYGKYSSAVSRSPVPFIFINPEAGLSEFRKLVLPVDLRKGNSDSALWSTYFGRFNNSEIIVVAANQKGKYEKRQVAENTLIADKLMKKFQINHKIVRGRKSSLHNTFEAFNLALSVNCDLFVMLGSSTITPIDRLIGLPEKKIITHAGEVPVMLINSGLDNYYLCD